MRFSSHRYPKSTLGAASPVVRVIMASDLANPRLAGKKPNHGGPWLVVTAFMRTLQAVHGTAPDPPCGEFDVEAVAEDGTRRRVPLASATRIRFADMTPARRIKAEKGQRNLPGRWWPVSDGAAIASA